MEDQPTAIPQTTDTQVIERPASDPAERTWPDAGRTVPPPPPPGTAAGGAGRARLGAAQYLAVAVVAALSAAAVAIPLSASDDAAAPAAATATAGDQSEPISFDPGDSLVSAIAKKVGPSVVRIDVAGARGSGSGSGVIYTADGDIITNAHVVSGAQRVTVTLPDGTTHEGEVLGADERSDIAVVHIDADGLPVASLASGTPDVGDTAIAIGSPFGLDGSVTAGIISAVNRTVPGGTNGTALIDVLQTDAAINPGNSGGALVDGTGQVIGINTAILSPGGGNDGIGFAIPIGSASAIADQVIEDGVVRYAFLGISGQDVDPDIAELYDLPADRGAVVASVSPGTPADDAGLQRTDIITAIDGEDVASMQELAARIQRHAPGDEVTLTVARGTETLELAVTLGEAPTG